MTETVDLAKATFNKTWEYLDRDDRTAEDDREMLTHAAASWYHWRQVGDSKNLAISDWQMARVLTVLGSAELAMSFATACLDRARQADVDAVYVGFGHEAVARAAQLAGDAELKEEHRAAAKAILENLTDPEDIELLRADLATLE